MSGEFVQVARLRHPGATTQTAPQTTPRWSTQQRRADSEQLQRDISDE